MIFGIKLTHRLIFNYFGQFPASVLRSYSVAPAGVEFLRQYVPPAVRTLTVALPLASTVCEISVLTGAVCSNARSKLRTTASGRIACCSIVVCRVVRGCIGVAGMFKFSGGGGAAMLCSVPRSGLDGAAGVINGVGVLVLPCAAASSPWGRIEVTPRAGCLRTAVCCRRGEFSSVVTPGCAVISRSGGEGMTTSDATGGSIRTCNRLGAGNSLALSPLPINGSSPSSSAWSNREPTRARASLRRMNAPNCRIERGCAARASFQRA